MTRDRLQELLNVRDEKKKLNARNIDHYFLQLSRLPNNPTSESHSINIKNEYSSIDDILGEVRSLAPWNDS